MAKHTSTDFMINYVKEYLDGETERMFFDLDFDHYLIQHYPKMEQENPELAECFGFYLSEVNDHSGGLTQITKNLFASSLISSLPLCRMAFAELSYLWFVLIL